MKTRGILRSGLDAKCLGAVADQFAKVMGVVSFGSGQSASLNIQVERILLAAIKKQIKIFEENLVH